MLLPECCSLDAREDISLSYGESGLDCQVLASRGGTRTDAWPQFIFKHIYLLFHRKSESSSNKLSPLDHHLALFLP